MLGISDPPDYRDALPQVAPQGLVAASPVPCDHGVRGLQDRVAGAVVLVQDDGPGSGEVTLEVEDVADRGPPEGVDGLVGIAHHHQLGRSGGRSLGCRCGGLTAQFTDQRVLGVVRVLVFVHQHMPEPAPVLLPDLREGLEQVDGGHDQVVEVEGVGGPEARLVFLIDPGIGLLHRS